MARVFDRPRRTTIALVLSVLGASPVFVEASAHADASVDRARAKDAYDRGTRAFDKGDFDTAAREYADADAIAPAPASLEAALVATMRFDDPARGLELIARADTRTLDANLAKTVNAARARFANRASRLDVDCKEAPSCIVSIDGVAREGRSVLYVKLGAHSIVLQRGDERIEQLIDARSPTVAFPSSSPSPAPSPPSSSSSLPSSSSSTSSSAAAFSQPSRSLENTSGVSPVAFYVAVGITAVAGGLTIASAFDTLSKHNAFVSNSCGGSNAASGSSCTNLSNDGKGSQARTDVGVAVTGALVLATAALGIFVVRWSPTKTSQVTASASPFGIGVELLTP